MGTTKVKVGNPRCLATLFGSFLLARRLLLGKPLDNFIESSDEDVIATSIIAIITALLPGPVE